MSALFADSFYFLALVNSDDSSHTKAVRFEGQTASLVTTEWVLTEVADALSDKSNRPVFLNLLNALQSSFDTEIIPASHELFLRGIELFAKRPDKDWSLTDCVSFVVMKDHGLADALTGDRHFEQAGFNVLLK